MKARSRLPRCWYWMLSPLAFGIAAGVASGQALAPAQDLRKDGEMAAGKGVPLIVLVSLEGCPHCEVVRRSHLLPLEKSGNDAPVPIIRQVELRGNAVLVDFNGERKTHAAFASQHRATIAPVVMFFSANGQPLASPLIGAMIPDFYGAYFDAALAEARTRIGANRQGARASP